MDKPQGTSFDNQLIELESVDSTNNYAMARIHAGLASAGQVYLAHRQWAGKGRRGKAWVAEPGQSISMSLVLEPRPLKISGQFLLGAAVAAGCLDTVLKYAPGEWKIKWPNDLYWGDRKAAGILIENVIKGKDWLYAVAGVGMNLNQAAFPPELPNPVSLKQITGSAFEPKSLAMELAAQIRKKVEVLQKDPQLTLATFNRHLYKRGETVKLKSKNIQLETRIESVNSRGQLITGQGRFEFGEVEFILE